MMSAKKGTGRDPKGAGRAYLDIMAKYPLLANGIQAAVINAAGVLTAQCFPIFYGEQVTLQWKPILIFMIIGAFVITPLIIHVLIGKIMSRGLNKFQLFVASTLFGMFVVNAAFVVSLGVLEELFDEKADLCLKPILRKVFTMRFIHDAIDSRKVFLPADILNAFFVPRMWQPLVGNVAGYIWTVVLAFRSMPA